MQTASALINFESLPFVVKSLPLTIRWRLERPLDSSIQVVLASFGQGPKTAQITPNFVLNTEHNLQSGIIPRIDLDPGLYVILAMNRTNRDFILAASQSFYFLPTASTPTSVRSGSMAQTNSTSLQKPGACDISVPATIPLPHLKSQMIILISMVAFLSLSVVVTLFIILRKKSFPCRRAKDCLENASEEEFAHTQATINPFRFPYCPSISPSTGKSRETQIRGRAYSLSSSLVDTPVSLHAPSSCLSSSSAGPTSSSPTSGVSAGQRNVSPPPQYCVGTQPV